MHFIFMLFVLNLGNICLSVSAQSKNNNVAKEEYVIDLLLKEMHEVKQSLGQEINQRKILEAKLDSEIRQREALEAQLYQEIRQREALETQVNIDISKRKALELIVGEINQQINLDVTGRIAELEDAIFNKEFPDQVYNEMLMQVPQNNTPIAFAVRQPQTESEGPGFSGTLLFQHIVTNLGEYYDKVTGQFTCAVSGIYLFSYNLRGESLKDGQHVAAYLRVNNDPTWYADCRNFGSDNVHINCGATVVLQCESGSMVEVYKAGYDISTGSYTWFTGFLISLM